MGSSGSSGLASRRKRRQTLRLPSGGTLPRQQAGKPLQRNRRASRGSQCCQQRKPDAESRSQRTPHATERSRLAADRSTEWRTCQELVEGGADSRGCAEQHRRQERWWSGSGGGCSTLASHTSPTSPAAWWSTPTTCPYRTRGLGGSRTLLPSTRFTWVSCRHGRSRHFCLGNSSSRPRFNGRRCAQSLSRCCDAHTPLLLQASTPTAPAAACTWRARRALWRWRPQRP